MTSEQGPGFSRCAHGCGALVTTQVWVMGHAAVKEDKAKGSAAQLAVAGHWKALEKPMSACVWEPHDCHGAGQA